MSVIAKFWGKLSDRQATSVLFITLSLVWSFTWIAGKYQINAGILPEFAVFYRFFTASIFVFCISYFSGLKLKITLPDLMIIIIYGLSASCLNFIFFYYAAIYMPTGLSAIVFSLSIIMSIFIGKYCFGIANTVNIKTVFFTLLGVVGLVCIFLPQFSTMGQYPMAWKGVVLAFLATLSFTTGSNYFQSRKVSLDLPVVFAYLTLIGSLWALLIGFLEVLKTPEATLSIIPNLSISFVVSFLYTSIIGTGIGYLCFLMLIKRIGSVKASYTSLVSPVLALYVSSLFEGYKFSFSTFVGIIMIIISITMARENKIKLFKFLD